MWNYLNRFWLTKSINIEDRKWKQILHFLKSDIWSILPSFSKGPVPLSDNINYCYNTEVVCLKRPKCWNRHSSQHCSPSMNNGSPLKCVESETKQSVWLVVTGWRSINNIVTTWPLCIMDSFRSATNLESEWGGFWNGNEIKCCLRWQDFSVD